MRQTIVHFGWYTGLEGVKKLDYSGVSHLFLAYGCIIKFVGCSDDVSRCGSNLCWRHHVS